MANTLKLGNGKWATGKDTVLSFSDTNNNFKPLPFDFSRASSATVVNQSGLIETVGSGKPRIDFEGNTKGALLLEPTRSNLITYSEDFSQSYWNKSGGVIISSNSTTSIDGTLNATKITGANAYGSVFIPSTTVLSGVKYTYSVFAKKNISSKVSLRAMTTGNDTRVVFNLDDLSTNISEGYDIGYDSSSIEVYSNGWYKCILTVTTATTSLRLNIYPDSPNNVSSQSGVYIYGAQLEQGSYATSYIPTSGQSGGVTRVAETSSQTVPDGVIGQTEGTVYCEVDVKSGYDTNNLMVTLSNGTNLKQIYINRSNGKLEFFVGTNVNEMLYVSPSVLTNGVHKLALAYKQDDFAVAIDGVIAHTDNSGNVPTCNKINVGSHYNGNLPFNDRINDVKLYNTRLSNADLQALTTI